MIFSAAAQATQIREDRSARFAAFWMIASIPLSLSSPGATVAMGMVALFALYTLARGYVLDYDLRRPGAIALVAWALVVIIDLLNGGGAGNLTTIVDYLPLAVLAPLAFGFRLSGLRVTTVDRAMQAAILIATAMSLFQAFWLGVDRPGGLNLNPVPYAFVVMLWGTFLLSRGLEDHQGRSALAAIVIALTAIVPILLSGSKMAWICTILAYGVVAVSWALPRRRLKTLIPAAVGAIAITLFTGFTDLGEQRLTDFWAEIVEFLRTGTSSGGSFGNRFEMIRSGFSAFLERPIIGHGLTESMAVTLAHSNPDGPDISQHSHIHNDYVVHLVSYGLFGLLFLGIYFWLMVRISLDCRMTSYRRAGLAITAALALYITAGIAFNMDPMSGAMAIVAGLLLAFRNEAGACGGSSEKV